MGSAKPRVCGLGRARGAWHAWSIRSVRTVQHICKFLCIFWKMAEEEERPYKAEYAKSSRAGCKQCKGNITKDTLRMAKMVQVGVSFLIWCSPSQKPILTFIVCRVLSLTGSSPTGTTSAVSSRHALFMPSVRYLALVHCAGKIRRRLKRRSRVQGEEEEGQRVLMAPPRPPQRRGR